MSTPMIDAQGAPQGQNDATPAMSRTRIVLRLILFIAVIGALALVLGPHFKRVLEWGLADNDDAMRVLQVRDWINGQGWFDVSQHRLNPPEGGDMHWSRLADLLLAALMAPLMAIFGPDLGPKYATFWAPLVGGVIFVWVSARTATHLGGPKAFLPALILAASAPVTLSYFLPGRVDHHGLQMTLIVAAIWGLLKGTKGGACCAGIAIAAGIAVGLEALPMQIILIGWVAARWGLRGEDVRQQTIGFGFGFGIAILVLFVATVPFERWNLPVNDAIGRGYVVLGCAGGLLLALAALALKHATLGVRIGALTAIGLIIMSGIAVFPEIIVPPYGNVDPLLVRLWLDNVSETVPLYSSKLSRSLSFALFPVFAAIMAVAAIFMTEDKERDLWILAALAIIVAAALAIFWQSRTAGLAMAISGIIAGALLTKAYARFGWKSAIALALVVNPILPAAAGTAIAKIFEPAPTAIVTGGGKGCYNQPMFKALSDSKPGLVVAPIDMGARILLTTNHKVMAAPYHRNNSGNLAAYQIFLMPQGRAKQRALSLGANYLAICNRSAEVSTLSRESPRGLMADLQAKRIPKWLTPLPQPKGSDVVAFRINAD
jgi:hypothetical protein